MFREEINETLQNKNTIMFITSILFMTGILSCFNNIGIYSSAIITLISIILILKQKMPLKYIFFWIIVFYLGYANAYCRTNDSDYLNIIAPTNTTIEGRITSIPQNKNDKIKFFLNVDKINDKIVDNDDKK